MRISDWSSDVCSSDLPNDGSAVRKMFGHANEGFVESPLGALIVSVAEERIGIHRRTQLCGNANSIRLVSAGIGLTRSRLIFADYAGEIIPPRDEIGRLGLELSAGVPGLTSGRAPCRENGC